MHNGIPPAHQVFWSQKSVEELFGLYVALIVNPRKVLGLLDEPLEFKNPSEERVYGYLQQYIGNMDIPQAQKFLCFATGSFVCQSTKI